MEGFLKDCDFPSALKYLDENKLEHIKEIVTHSMANRQEIRVKLLCNWMTSNELCKLWSKMSKNGSGKWSFRKPIIVDGVEKTAVQITASNNLIDYYIVINSTTENVDPAKTIVFQMEPHMSTDTKWGWWSDPKVLRVLGPPKSRNNGEWHLSYSFTHLNSPFRNLQKENRISAILSTKDYDPGHKKRLAFVQYITDKGLEIDVFGSAKLGNYKGPLPPYQKENGLLNYKYHFACENNKIPGYATEKIYDAILCECLCFYWGDPDIGSVIDPRAYVVLSLNNFEKDFNTIVTALKEDLWSQRASYIREAKQKILHELQFFPYLEKVLTEVHKDKI